LKIGKAIGQRLALLAGEQAANLLLSAQQLVADCVEEIGARLRGRRGPLRKGRFGSCDRAPRCGFVA
jgi:hypothetical protein